ncbi:helicase-associated domain-containing protein [Leifsonia sp. ZF2019]|uniref:helicase-associated domain-containing protein n=1 Tax=Leifsonia sp. ZF2019 TaxID=2781978 RepID=UPI001CBF8A15|nr:helicase-associated domain-containing protein [Leifsonia sp. ZF2019]UAJ78532.1 helicase-associated domain-containing protein [Leifsonia sp. ZF2019]
MTTTLALAARLRALPDDELVAALRHRSVRRSGISDFFDLAEALLDGESVQRALVALDRTRLATLIVLGRAGPLEVREVAVALDREPATAGATEQQAAAALDALSGLLLAHPADGDPEDADPADGRTPRYGTYDAVSARLIAWPDAGLPSPDELLRTAPPPALAPVPDTERRFTDRLAADRAFEAVVAVSELLAELGREGARELQRGGLALPAVKRLSEALAVDADAVPTVLSVASRAGLVAVEAGQWLPAEPAAAWLHASTPDRWRALAGAWLGALPDDLRALVADRSRAEWGDSLREHVGWLYPAAADEARARVDAHLRDAEWLGITAHGAPSGPGTVLVEEGPEASADALAPAFPAEVRQVYLQHDLTMISPGPLAPDLEARLRTMADLESRALASTFRFSPASVDRAITAGETAATIREFLSGISLTGLPQPLDYLITDVTERHGRVRVRTVDEGEARTAVRSSDTTLLRTIEVDQSLSSLRLTPARADVLHSRFPRDVVFWALSDARYPVVAEDENGEPVTLRRQRYAHPQTAPTRDQDRELVERLRAVDAAVTDDTAEQWLARQLDQAVRARQPVVVEVAMPDGSVVDLVLEPTGVGGGRLRGRDRSADIERTLPLSSVKAVRPL